jgi:hypothetical protein
LAPVALPSVPATASAGSEDGTEVKECFAPLGLGGGEAIQAWKQAQPAVKMTAKTTASVHCGG